VAVGRGGGEEGGRPCGTLQGAAFEGKSVPYSYWSLGGVLISLPKAMSP